MAPPEGRKAWDIPPFWFLLTIVAMVLLHLALPIMRVDVPTTPAGVLAILAGVALAVWGERSFKRAGTAVRPFEPSSALVQDGPFRFTRNPMYLGMLLVLAGIALLLGTLGPVLAIPVFVWLLRNRFVLLEEAHMQRHFGAAYDAYRQRVRRWL